MQLIDLELMVETVTSWFAPPHLGHVTGLLISVMLVVGVVILLMRSANPVEFRERDWLPGVSSAALHTGAVVVSAFLFDDGDTFVLRLMFPVALSLLFAATAVSGHWATTSKVPSDTRTKAAWLVGGAALVASLSITGGEAIGLLSGERGFLSDDYQASSAIEYVLAQEEDWVFSSHPDGLWVLGRPGVWALPSEIEPLSGLENEAYAEELAFVRDKVSTGDAVVAVLPGRDWLIPTDALEWIAPCVLMTDDVVVVRAGRGHPDCEE
jgi:hypothetical protein